jgi:hypothetical protein
MPHWLFSLITSDRVIAAATFIYALVTVVMFLEIRSQSKAARRQAEIADNAAKAAKQSADALITSERAWVMVNLQLPTDRMRIVEIISNGIPKISIEVCFVCQNDGRTPAWILEKRIWFRMVESLADKPDITQPLSFVEVGTEPLNVGASSRRKIELECEGDLRSGLGTVIYGHVIYRDVFRPDRETWFGYAVILSQQANRLDRLAGYPEYNKNT